MEIIGIACVDKNFAIGKTNKETGIGKLLFKIPQDLQTFKAVTERWVVIYGYNTYLSLPKRPLPNRINVVLWDKATSTDCLPGCITFKTFDELLNFVKIISVELKVYICGGASVYNLFLPYYDRVILTKVDAEDKEATVFFPNLDKDSNYELISTSDIMKSNNYNFIFNTYRRIK